MKKVARTLISILLLLCLSAPVMAAEVSSTIDTQAEPLKVLTIGNSYAQDSMPLINSIAKAQGDEFMTVGFLYYPGCTLKLHARYGKNDEAVYTYYKNTDGTTVKTEDSTLLTALQDEDWDIIFLQQAPCESGEPATFDTHLDDLINFVNENKTNPDAKFGWHLTWAYQKAYQTIGATYSQDFIDLFQGDPLTMYNAIVATAQEKVLSRTLQSGDTQVNEFVKLTPSGTAIENARSSYFGDNLQRDSYHLNQLGKVITAYTWYATLTDQTALTSIELDNATSKLTLSEQDRLVILESVNNALANPYERTQSQYTQRPDEDVYFVLNGPKASGGTVEAYNQKDPTAKVTVEYTGRKNNTGKNSFYKMTSGGVLESQTIVLANVATASYHNYFYDYDAATQTLYLEDNITGHGTSGCGFSCSTKLGNGGLELPATLFHVPATIPVVDVTGVEHGITTLQDVIDLSDVYTIRLNYYAPDAGVPAAFYADEVVELEYPAYTMQHNDVFFATGTVKAGEKVEGYIINSATKTPGSKVTVDIPTGTAKADGYNSTTRSRFWQMLDGTLNRVGGIWYSGQKYAFSYHETITDLNETTLKTAHAEGHTGSKDSCGYNFADACGNTKQTTRYYEAATNLSVTSNTVVVDLRASVLEGAETAVTTLTQVKALTDLKNAVINVYAPDGACGTTYNTGNATGTAKVIVVVEPTPDFTPNRTISVGNVENGTVTVDKTVAKVGETVTVTATPDTGYELVDILVDGEVIQGSTFPISGNHTVTAVFQASENYYTVDQYKATETAPTKDGHVFGGWYADAAFTNAYTGTTGKAYAKFVDEAVLSVKAQITAGTNASSEFSDIRFLTTVDSLNYKKIGFKITFRSQTTTEETSTVYTSIVSKTDGIAVDRTPSDFHETSRYFMTYVVSNVPNANFTDTFIVTPYWVTMDGTVVDGVTNTLSISMGY